MIWIQTDRVFVQFGFISVCFSVQKLSEFFASEEIEPDQDPKTPTPTDTNHHSNIKSVVSTCYNQLQISREYSNQM